MFGSKECFILYQKKSGYRLLACIENYVFVHYEYCIVLVVLWYQNQPFPAYEKCVNDDDLGLYLKRREHMVKSNQAVWAQNEMFLMLGHLMDPDLDANTLFTAFKKFHGWMLFAKDDTLLSTYLEVCERRLFDLPLELRQQAAKKILECAKSYPYSKEYLPLLKVAQKLLG
jgi:hypothetical protein